MVLSGYILLYSSSRVRGDGPIRLYISILKSSRVRGDGSIRLYFSILKSSRVSGDGPIRLYISILKSSRVRGDGTVLPMPAGGLGVHNGTSFSDFFSNSSNTQEKQSKGRCSYQVIY